MKQDIVREATRLTRAGGGLRFLIAAASLMAENFNSAGSEAIMAAKQLVDGHDVELWQRERRIERFNRLE
jgi:hypothetical protein